MSEVRILIGIPGSGKTTYARYLEKYNGYVRLSQDEMIRIPNRLGLTQRIFQAITESVKSGKNVVIDGTYIEKSKRKELVSFCENLNAEIVFCVFSANVKDCIKHNETKQEETKPTDDVIREMKERLENPTKKECKRIEKITDEWFKEHEKEIELLGDYEMEIRRKIIMARLSIQ